jgi:hypothetical protein
MASQGRGAKVKGSGYELKIAKLFSPWWGGQFHRVPGSGSLHWGDDNRVAGDIAAPQGLDFPFVVECKKHEGWTMDHVLLNIGDPFKWWGQVVTDARRVRKVPLLIFSRNRAKDYVMVPFSNMLYTKLLSLGNDHMRTTVAIKNIRDEEQLFDVIVTTFDTFSKLSPTYLRDYCGYVDWDIYKDEYQ